MYVKEADDESSTPVAGIYSSEESSARSAVCQTLCGETHTVRSKLTLKSRNLGVESVKLIVKKSNPRCVETLSCCGDVLESWQTASKA